MDESEDEKSREPLPRPLSKTPSWVTLGFLLGVAFMWFLPRPETAPAPVTPAVAPPQPPPADIALIEAVFGEWSQYAMWTNDKTEVALWEPVTKTYAHYFEVLRDGERYYFRSIAGLSRPVLTHGVPEDSPLVFTETEQSRREWLNERAGETWKALSGAARGSFPGAKPEPKRP
jgi:hypothetical protein